jgi:hypothetical protein
MPRYINPVPQYHDSQGNILVEGFLLFEESGTNTKKDIYHDVDLTIAATNPVKLDGAGRTPSLFTEGLYKVTAYKDDGLGAPGEQQWSRDPVGDDADGFGSVWGQTSTYALDDVVQGSDGEYYISIIAANKGNDPTTTPSAWSRINLIVDWNTNETYAAKDLVKGSDGSLYYSVIGSNVGNDPTADDGTNWKNTGQSAIDAAIGVTVQAWSDKLDSVAANGLIENLIPLGDAALNPHQRGTSVTGISDGQYVADLVAWKQSGTMVLDYAIGTGSETSSKSFKFTVPLEGKNVAHLNYGGSDASSTTYGFKVRAKKAGTFCLSIMNSAGDRVYIDEITISSADTWELKTATIPGDTTGTWLTDTGIGLKLIICLAAGTDHHGTADTWQATGDFATSNQTNFVSTIADYFEFEFLRSFEGSADLGPNYPDSRDVIGFSHYYYRELLIFLGSSAYQVNSAYDSQSKLISPMRADPSIGYLAPADASATVVADWVDSATEIQIRQDVAATTSSTNRGITLDASWSL